MVGGRAGKIAGWGALSLTIIFAIGFFGFGPQLTEESLNQIDDKELPTLREDALALHNSLTIVDLHSDSLLWKRDITKRASRGHMDLPRLQDGNVALQIFSSVTKTPKNQNYDNNSADGDSITPLVIAQLQPIKSWTSLLQRSLWHAKKMDRAVANSDSQLTKITDARSITALLDKRDEGASTVGAFFSAEGLHNLEGRRENLEKLYAAGTRMAGLTHFFDNKLAGSMHGEEKGGLTKFGRQIMADMEDSGIIVDIAHCSHKCVGEILKAARRPVVSSHGGVQATCGVNRNLTDEEIRGVAATGGIIGVGYWEGAVCDTSPAAVAKAMKHIRDLVGIQHVALGSDYDGAVTVRFDTSALAHVTQALIDAGFSETEIRAAMGGNALRVLRAGLTPLSAAKAQSGKAKDSESS